MRKLKFYGGIFSCAFRGIVCATCTVLNGNEEEKLTKVTKKKANFDDKC